VEKNIQHGNSRTQDKSFLEYDNYEASLGDRTLSKECGLEQETGQSVGGNQEVDVKKDGEIKDEYALHENKQEILGSSNRKPYKRELHLSGLQCPKCERIFTQNGSLNTHFLTIHENKAKHDCGFCNTTFNKKSNLERHIQRKHT